MRFINALIGFDAPNSRKQWVLGSRFNAETASMTLFKLFDCF